MTSPAKDLLVAAPDRWDEACFAIPAVRAIRASGLNLGLVCRHDQAPLWHTLNDLEVIAYPPKSTPKSLSSLIGKSWQAALTWHPGIAADAFKRAAIPRILGPLLPQLKSIVSHPLAGSGSPLDHRVRFYLATAEAMGIPTAQPAFFAPSSLTPAPPQAPVLLCPDSDFGASHEWKPERWYELGKALALAGHRLRIVGCHGGRELGQRLAKNLGLAAEYRSVSILADALPWLAEHRWLVAADGSLPHVASQLGVTCATLFGPNDPAWRRPLGKRHAVVRQHVECAPCQLAKCPFDGRCQNELSVDKVWAAVSAMLGQAAD